MERAFGSLGKFFHLRFRFVFFSILSARLSKTTDFFCFWCSLFSFSLADPLTVPAKFREPRFSRFGLFSPGFYSLCDCALAHLHVLLCFTMVFASFMDFNLLQICRSFSNFYLFFNPLLIQIIRLGRDWLEWRGSGSRICTLRS